MVKDGLWDVYNDYHMGNAAEVCAREMDVGREAQDAFARSSYEKALAAQAAGAFKAEIVPVEVPQRRGEPIVVDAMKSLGVDVQIKWRSYVRLSKKAERSPLRMPVASMMVLRFWLWRVQIMPSNTPLPILARLSGMTQHAQAPEWFTTAPAYAMNALLSAKGLSPTDIDLYEVNEAFSVVSLACNDISKLPAERVNVNGGAVALGHPIGASGARILVTLLHAMQSKGADRGLASLCIGGGEAVAVLVESVKSGE